MVRIAFGANIFRRRCQYVASGLSFLVKNIEERIAQEHYVTLVGEVCLNNIIEPAGAGNGFSILGQLEN